MTNAKILVVEDERIIAEDILRTLKNFGYTVTSLVSSGREALEKAEENRPDLVLMDIKLRGDIDGVEVAERIRARHDIPIIYITALADSATLQRAKITEPFGYIHKPIEERDLLTTIEIGLYKHEMEKKLKKSEELFRTIVETTPSLLIITDKNGKNVYVSPNCQEITGYTPEELLGRVVWWVHEDDTPRAKKVFGRTFNEERGSRNFEYKAVKKKGDIWYASSSWEKLRDNEGKFQGVVMQTIDITERKMEEKERERLQAQLVQSEKMAGVGTLAGGIAHEFNNLLQIMSGHVQYAQRTKKSEDIKDAFNVVLNSSARGAKIIKDLLMFSRQKPCQRECCDITKSIELVLSLVEEQLKRQNIKVLRRYEAKPVIEVNKPEIEQVFLNIVVNARDTMQQRGGELEIGVKEVEGHVEVSFRDTGEGIEEENLKRVFEPFYTTKEAIGGSATVAGTGLGLSVSYGIVKRHGGTIEVESQIGKGTTFTVRLPVGKGGTKRGIKGKKKEGAEKAHPLNILVVDDEKEICRMFTKFLSAEGHRLKAAATGRKALNLVKKEYFDVVFLDIIMPGTPSVEVLERIKKGSPQSRNVIMTGQLIDNNLRHELKRKGASVFLQKPFKIKEIKRIINQDYSRVEVAADARRGP